MDPFKKGNYQAPRAQDHNAGLPPKIKCGACGRNRDQVHFSNKQLQMVQNQLARRAKYGYGPAELPGRGKQAVRCRQCTGQQTAELLCVVCGCTKELMAFAKNQRKEPDNAKCTECMENVAKVGESDDEEKPAGVAYEDLSDGDFEYDEYRDYTIEGDDDDTKSMGTNDSTIWATLEDGDYATASDVSSSVWGSRAGSDTRSYSGASAYGSGRQTGGYRPENRYTAGRKQPDARGWTSKSDVSSQAASRSSRLSTSTVPGNITREPYRDNFHDDDDGREDEWQAAAPSKGKRPEGRSEGRPAETFAAWAQKSRKITDSRDHSPASTITSREAPYRTTRRMIKPSDDSNKPFPKVRPQNRLQHSAARSPNVRREAKHDNGGDEDQFYDLSNASEGPGHWDKDGLHW